MKQIAYIVSFRFIFSDAHTVADLYKVIYTVGHKMRQSIFTYNFDKC